MSKTSQFACVLCGYAYTKATTTNPARSAPDIRRRRMCLKCEEGFVTYEVTAADYAMLQALRKWSTRECNSEKAPMNLSPETIPPP